MNDLSYRLIAKLSKFNNVVSSFNDFLHEARNNVNFSTTINILINYGYISFKKNEIIFNDLNKIKKAIKSQSKLILRKYNNG